jgi:tetratricopeptide (TPR) repeat protein
VREIAAALGATHVLEGSLRRNQDQLRITVQLIDASSGLHIWSNSYDMPMGDIFQIEDTVSRIVAEKLHLELTPAVNEQWSERRAQTTDAFELYLLARDRQLQRTAEDNIKAAEYFRRALEADPKFVPALTGLSETLLNGLSLNRFALEDVAAEIEPLINRASQLSANSPSVLAVRGWLLTEQFKIDEALPLLQRAIKGNPNDDALHRMMGNLYERLGHPTESLAHFSAAASLDPMDFITQVWRCTTLTDLEDFAGARAACERARETDRANLWGPLATSWIARAEGNTAEAIRWIDEARKLAPSDTMLADQKMDLLYMQGRAGEARAIWETLPKDDSFFTRAREANLVFAEGGPQALKAWLAEHKTMDYAGTSAELAELARLQVTAGDAVTARATLAHAEKLLPMSVADLYDGSQIRHEYSAALVHARIELLGNGDRERALRMLAELEKLLDAFEKNGGKHYGLFALRGELYALRGEKERARKAYETAWKHGWRARWRTIHDPFLAGVTLAGDSSK